MKGAIAVWRWIRSNLRLVLSVACLVAAAAWWGARYVGPAPPVPDEIDRMDPAIAELIEGGATAVRRSRRDPAAWLRLGMVYEANGMFRYALSCYERVRARRPEVAGVWQRIAAVHERIGDLESAVAAMERAAALDPDFAPAQWQLGLWLLDVGRGDEAAERLARAIALDPGARPAWYGRARLHLERGEPERAIEVIEGHGLCEGPNGPYGWRLLGRAERQRGRPEAAQRAFGRGEGRPPDFGEVWSATLLPYRAGEEALRQDFARQRGTPQGESILRRLLERDPQDVLALNEVAVIEMQRRRFEPALLALATALEVAPDDFQTNANVAVALVTMPAAPPAALERALVHVDRALATRPSSGKAWRVRGAILARLGRPEEALAELTAAYDRDARATDLLMDAGRLELELERWPDARATFERVLARKPESAAALLGLARTQLELGALDEAEATLDRAAPAPPALADRAEALRADLAVRRAARPPAPAEAGE